MHDSRKEGDVEICIPKDCPLINYGPFLSSPTTCFPREVQEQVDICIEKANELLLDLALSHRKESEGISRNEELKTILEGVQDCEVILTFDIPLPVIRRLPAVWRNIYRTSYRSFLQYPLHKTSWLTGRLQFVGRDYLELVQGNQRLMISFDRVTKVIHSSHCCPKVKEPALIHLDPCARRELVFDFGRFVSSHPGLLHTFFGLNLRHSLLFIVNETVKIYTDDEIVLGKLHRVEKEHILVRRGKNEILIPMRSILLLKTRCIVGEKQGKR